MVDRIFPGSGVNSFLRSNSIIKGSDDTQEGTKTLEEIATLDIPRTLEANHVTEGYCPYRNGGMGGISRVMSSVKNGVSNGMNRMRRFHPMGHVNYGGFSVVRLVIFIVFLFAVVYVFTSPYVSRKMNDIKDTITSNTRSLTSDIIGKREGGLKTNERFDRLVNKYLRTSPNHGSIDSSSRFRGASSSLSNGMSTGFSSVKTIPNPSASRASAIRSSANRSMVDYSGKEIF